MKFLRDPLTHFLIFGALLFAAHAVWTNIVTNADRQLVVDTREIARQSDLFAIENSRPPSSAELQGIIIAYVEEEVLAREAKALGLDRDDTVVRRRLAQKMRLLSDAGPLLEPTDETLIQYFDDNRQNYRIPERRTVQHVFFSEDRRDDAVRDAASADLSDWARVGDPFIVARQFGPDARRKIVQDYGEAFADAAFANGPGLWSEPVRSPFGIHRVRVTEVALAVEPLFETVRTKVLADWTAQARKARAAQTLRDRVARYDVIIEE